MKKINFPVFSLPSDLRRRPLWIFKTVLKNLFPFFSLSPQIYVDGPFGAPSSHIFRAQHAVLIGTGIGVTPFASILQSIMHKYWKARHICPSCSYSWTNDVPDSVMNLRKVCGMFSLFFCCFFFNCLLSFVLPQFWSCLIMAVIVYNTISSM